MWMSPQAVYIHFRNVSGYFSCCRNVSKRLRSLCSGCKNRDTGVETGTHGHANPLAANPRFQQLAFPSHGPNPALQHPKVRGKAGSPLFFRRGRRSRAGSRGVCCPPAAAPGAVRAARGEAHPWARPQKHPPAPIPASVQPRELPQGSS